ncbi:hypothetical protein A1D31_22540 [Bradyrhizobium liaoningense]|nr:hypothetical protein A1D31_22540 [Bradyrhizobium liaoningense]
MTEPQAFRDLTKLARDRCRTANESVIQLLDNEQEAAALLLFVAADMVYGASSFLGDENKPKALQAAINLLIENLRAIPARNKEMRS